MNILVTGCAGFIGSHLCDALIKKGHNVIGIDNLSTGNMDNVNDEVKFYKDDIRSYIDVDYIFLINKIDVIFHLAALARIQPSIDDPTDTFDVNVNGTINILTAARSHKVKKFIFAGSSSVYSGEELPSAEWSDKAYHNPYTLSKHIGEELVKLYGDLYGFEYAVPRFFNVWGPRQLLTGAYAAVVGIFLDQKHQHKALTITGDGKQRRDFTHVSDIVAGLIKIMEHKKKLNCAINLGTGKNTSMNELADMISPHQNHIEKRPGEVDATQADNSFAKSELNWVPRIMLNKKNIERYC